MGNMTLANDAKTVDDVLASIRKLVSDETRARSMEVEKKAGEAKPAEPLMLTPELKVADVQKPLVLETPASNPEPVAAKNDAPEVEIADRPQPAQMEPVQSAPVQPQDTETTAPFQDEMALRALVSEMIREELQGELGNRITRNVRKMVRREIEQAMKAQTDA